MKRKLSIYSLLLVLCTGFSAGPGSPAETFVTMEIWAMHPVEQKFVKMEGFQSELRCIEQYIIELTLKTNRLVVSSADPAVPDKETVTYDSSYNLINMDNRKFVRFDTFSKNASPTASADLKEKKQGVQMDDIKELKEDAVRLKDTAMNGISYMRYRVHEATKEVTAYLIPVKNKAVFSMQKKIETAVNGTIVLIDYRDVNTGDYLQIRFKYEDREIPAQEYEIIQDWISKTKW
ncbi:hypothetical protein GFS24_06430 [Chitinophaga sp. SYP-B3965]|uniref:hypothetical protein n=1 Tax=Chitinophaga sp. SYP-B3965 TaxID=2663120 RepID=UPI001299CE2B|nr:hypothetical protein [Chitinophaga sp. SYP-B3965]MRG44741.1 hypothetical protein [Chitinophaga sp. SYP-B3965]